MEKVEYEGIEIDCNKKKFSILESGVV